MIALLVVGLLAQAQPAEGEVDRIMLRFRQNAQKVRTDEAFKALLQATRGQLEKFVKDHPKHKDAERASFHIAESFLSAEEPEKGLERFRAFLRDYPGSPNAAAARYAIGEVLLQLENFPAAREAFEDFVKHHGKEEQALFAKLYIAVTFQNEKKYDEAARRLREARKEYKDRKESWSAVLQLAVLQHVSGRNDEATATLEEIIRECPDREAVELSRRHLAEYVKIGKDAPAFVEKDLQKEEQSVEKYRGKVVVLYFFDSTLKPSEGEAAFLKKARQAHGPEGLQILGVSVDRDLRDLKLFMDQGFVAWPVLFDARGFDGLVPLLYGVRSLPALWVIDRKGKVRYFNLAGIDLRHAIEHLLQEK